MSSPAPAGYPGNPSLPREVREKILSTFRHTLNLYHQGKSDDCVIGCDFILKMDPRFAPARKLMEKAKNPAAEVDVEELEALVTATPTRQERVAAVEPDRLLVRAVESYNARDFDAAISAAEQVLAVLPGNRDALEILDKAAGKKASLPLFEASRQRAISALESDRGQDARQELDRMRDLDPDHPAVTLLERRIGGLPPAPPVIRPAPSPSQDSDDIRFDLTASESHLIGELGRDTHEPDIQFDTGSAVSPPELGLESLSLDSLSLDSGPSDSVDMDSTNPGAVRASAPPPPPPGSPADLWGASAGGFDIEEAAPSPQPGYAPPPGGPPPPPPPMVPEEEDAGIHEHEIEGLMRQGDEMARRGDRQQAIEIWSRIFLIDINNAGAVSRIEKVREEMSEGNRAIAEGLKAGRENFEAGSLPAARELFLHVLTLDANEPTARFYLDKIEEALTRGAASSAPVKTPAAGRDFEEAAPKPSSPTAAVVPPPAAAAAPRKRIAIPVPPRVLAIIGVAVVAIAIGMYFVFKSPRGAARAAGKTGPAAAAAPAGSLARARELSEAGQAEDARKELARIPRSSPDYPEARRMLAELGGKGSTAAGGAPSVAVVPGGAPGAPGAAPGPNDPARIRATAEQALTEKRYIEALKDFNLAAHAFRNDPTFTQSMGAAAEKVQALTPAVKLYNEAEYDTAIPLFWRLYQEDRQNQDARSYLLRCYYNQGVTELQNGLFPKAIQSFDEALAVDPRDTEVIRHRKFAERYLKNDLDLMGRIYVRHLPHRP